MNLPDKLMLEYRRWLDHAVLDQEVSRELEQMEGDDEAIADAFYKNLQFGTGGLRGVIGAGTNRMNIYTIARAAQGLANYLIKHFRQRERSVAIGFDSRVNSELFARTASDVLAANRFKVFLFPELMPTPCLSFAVRKLKCAAGIMVTASHNPAEYNGYKVYGQDGGQITDGAASEIWNEIEALDILNGSKRSSFEEGVRNRAIQYISKPVVDAYMKSVKELSLYDKKLNRDIKIVYSPLNGSGRKPVLRCLQECGFKNITLVAEQEMPDGRFPTCPYPNPEEKEAMALGIEYAGRVNAELVLATDPDCDRVGISVRDESGDYILLSGNETGVLLFDYICRRRLEMGTMPDRPVMIKTIVTTDMAEIIAADYGVETINVLTGFKYIGEQIGLLEQKGRAASFIWGFEESYGYLSGVHVRDKDAVNGSMLICEMLVYYKEKGITLLDRLGELYKKYGYWMNTLYSFQFTGADGSKEMQKIMEDMRKGAEEVAGYKVTEYLDYSMGIQGLPKSNVIKFKLDNQSSVVLRPSGTEPKLKIYISASSKTEEEARLITGQICSYIEQKLSVNA